MNYIFHVDGMGFFTARATTAGVASAMTELNGKYGIDELIAEMSRLRAIFSEQIKAIESNKAILPFNSSERERLVACFEKLVDILLKLNDEAFYRFKKAVEICSQPDEDRTTYEEFRQNLEANAHNNNNNAPKKEYDAVKKLAVEDFLKYKAAIAKQLSKLRTEFSDNKTYGYSLRNIFSYIEKLKLGKKKSVGIHVQDLVRLLKYRNGGASSVELYKEVLAKMCSIEGKDRLDRDVEKHVWEILSDRNSGVEERTSRILSILNVNNAFLDYYKYVNSIEHSGNMLDKKAMALLERAQKSESNVPYSDLAVLDKYYEKFNRLRELLRADDEKYDLFSEVSRNIYRLDISYYMRGWSFETYDSSKFKKDREIEQREQSKQELKRLNNLIDSNFSVNDARSVNEVGKKVDDNYDPFASDEDKDEGNGRDAYGEPIVESDETSVKSLSETLDEEEDNANLELPANINEASAEQLRRFRDFLSKLHIASFIIDPNDDVDQLKEAVGRYYDKYAGEYNKTIKK